MYLKKPLVLHDQAEAAADGVVHHDPDYKLTDLRRSEAVLEIVDDATSAFSVQPAQSLDGETWYSIGSALTAAGLTVLTVTAPYFKAELESITPNGGSVSVTVA